MAVLLAILIGVALGIARCSKPSIIGRWDLDGTTVYEFEKGGKGALILLTKKYEFTYSIDDDLLRINFLDDAALDADYVFEVEQGMLFLTGGPGDAKTEFVLKKRG